jgi:DNA-binding NtrC family response regulator
MPIASDAGEGRTVVCVLADTARERPLTRAFEELGWAVLAADSTGSARTVLSGRACQLCVIDFTGDGTGGRAAHTLRSQFPGLVLLGMADPARPDAAAEAIAAGVFDVLLWPVSAADLRAVTGNIEERMRPSTERGPATGWLPASVGVFGTSFAMRRVMELVARAAPRRSPVLLCGERGTGREMVARALHEVGSRAGGPFVKVDCGSPERIAGIVQRGAAQGRRRSPLPDPTPALLAPARGGTLFLENLASLSPPVQAGLARWLRDNEAISQPSDRFAPESVRLIAGCEPGDTAATHGLRQDLLEQLSRIRIDLPPLRHRREDIPLLATFFVKQVCQAHGIPLKTFTHPALTLLAALPWPGNARELFTLVERLVLLTPQGLVKIEDVLAQVHLDGGIRHQGETLRQARERFEREYIAGILRQHHGRMSEAAAALGLQRPNLYRKVRQLRLSRQGAPAES